MNITWDAELYASNFDYIHRYGEGVLSLIDAPEGAKALDLGCGNGELTASLKKRGYDVIGLDASPELLAEAEKGMQDVPSDLFSVPPDIPVILAGFVLMHFNRFSMVRQPV